MKIAVTVDFEKNLICGSFEQCRHFNVYDTENDRVICSELVGTMNGSVQDKIDMLGLIDADTVICGNISANTDELLSEEGILCCSGIYGEADDAVEQFLSGQLSMC